MEGSLLDTNAEAVTGRRRDVLELLRGSPAPLMVSDLAERLRVHPNTIRFHIDALVSVGLVERIGQVGTGPGRPAVVFRVRPGMDPAGPRGYRLLASMLVDSLRELPDGIDRAITAGRRWGRRLIGERVGRSRVTDDEAVTALIDLLADLGFSPEVSGADNEIRLHHCPFLELTQSETGLICPVHLGMMQGALVQLGSSLTVDRLSPFVEPDLCLAHIANVEEAGDD
jgi:predicted ArsR family transcriptional regulator